MSNLGHLLLFFQTNLAMSFRFLYTHFSFRSKGKCLSLGIAVLSLQNLQSKPIAFEDACARASEVEQIDELSKMVEGANQARLAKASRFPNPSLYYERESARGTKAFDESTVGVSSKLDFLWKRGTRIESAEIRNSVSDLQIDLKRLKISYEIAKIFIKYSYLKEEIYILEEAIEQHNQVLTFSNELLAQGIIPALHLKRINLRVDELTFSHRALKSKMAGVLTRFRLWVGLNDVFPAYHSLLYSVSLVSSEQAIQQALRERPDLLSLKANAKWKAKQVEQFQNEKFPEISLDIASKKYPEKQDGLFFGISMELPLGEKQGDLNLAKAAEVSGELEYQIKRKEIEREVNASWQIWHHLQRDQNRSSSNNDLESGQVFLSGLELSFKNGEISVFEYLDSLGSFLTAKQNALKYSYEKQSAYLNLTYLSGLSPHFTLEKN